MELTARPLAAALVLLFTGWAGSALGEDTALVLGEVPVRDAADGPLPTRKILSSVDVLGGDQVEQQNVSQSWRLFSQLPGVQVTEFGMGLGAQSGKLSFRGFNGEGDINAVKLLIDGIPSNSNIGNMPYLDMVFPTDIESIEVVRGTNDPRYGLYNIAGNVSLTTRIGGNETRLRTALGGFNTFDLQATKALEQDGVSQNYFIGRQTSDGYRHHSASEKTSVAGKWFVTGDDYRLGVIARHYEGSGDEPGYLTRAEVSSDPRQSPDRNNTDRDILRMNQLSMHWEKSLNERLYWVAKAYTNTDYDRRWVRFFSAQQERLIDETQYGLLSNLTYRPSVNWAQSFSLEGGVDMQWQQNDSQRYNTVGRVRTSVSRNQSFDLDVYGAYAQAVIQLNPQWKLIPAYRADVIRGSYVNRVNGVKYDVNDYGVIGQPKFSAVYSPDPRYSLYGNVGRTFQVGLGTATYKVTQTANVDPSVNDGWELGVKFTPVAGVEGRISLWRQVASGEIGRDFNTNSSVNIGKTRRQGLDLQAAANAGERTRYWAGMSFQTSKILAADADNPLSQGKEINHVPHRLFSAGVDYQATSQLSLSLTARGQSSYYTERTNSKGQVAGYGVLDVSLGYRLDAKTRVDVQIKNLADKRYEYAWYDTTSAQNLYTVGDGRVLFGSLSLKF